MVTSIINSNMDDTELPTTLTPKEGTIPVPSQEKLGKMPWGRLISCKRFLESIDLIDSFTFGRSEECSMIVTLKTCPENLLSNISKLHFKIVKNEEDNFAYITDLSKNGTFVNEVKIGTGKQKIIRNDDIISIAMAKFPIYIFRSLQVTEDFLPTELISKYVNVRQLGRGSCGEVRLVKDRDTFKEFAIKKIILGASNTSQIHKINHPSKIDREIEILRTLQHPCIITCKDVIPCGKEMYLVLEYMAGGELTERVRHYPMTEDCVKFYFLQMLCAVQYLHSKGVIHRDLKPENILLLDHRQETVLKITDFGLSKITYASDMTTQCGTLRYVAPEVLHNDFRDYGEYGKKVDVWSLGVILYFMISREFPFSGEDSPTVIKKIVKCTYGMSGEIWQRVSPEVKHLITKILVVKAKNRPDILKIIHHPWIKNDYGVKYRVENLLHQEGLENPLEDLVLEPPAKKFRFNSFSSSSSSGSSSDDLEKTLLYVEGGDSFSSASTLCSV